MEKFRDSELDIVQVFDDNISMILESVALELNCDDISKLTQTQFKYILSYIGKRLFSDNRLLKGFPNNRYNEYDYKVIYALTIRYIDLCYKYNKLPSFLGLSLFLNISDTSIQNWNNRTLLYNNDSISVEDTGTMYSTGIDNGSNVNGRKVSVRPIDIYNMVLHARQDGLKDIAIDSKQVIGVLAIGNNEYGWNMPGVSGRTESRVLLSAADLPKLETRDN